MEAIFLEPTMPYRKSGKRTVGRKRRRVKKMRTNQAERSLPSDLRREAAARSRRGKEAWDTRVARSRKPAVSRALDWRSVAAQQERERFAGQQSPSPSPPTLPSAPGDHPVVEKFRADLPTFDPALFDLFNLLIRVWDSLAETRRNAIKATVHRMVGPEHS